MTDLYDKLRKQGLVEEPLLRASVECLIGEDCPYPSAAALARDIGMHPEQMRMYLRGKRPAEPKLLRALGYERVVLYRPVNKSACAGGGVLANNKGG